MQLSPLQKARYAYAPKLPNVITSYSIHYTKLYEGDTALHLAARLRAEPQGLALIAAGSA